MNAESRRERRTRLYGDPGQQDSPPRAGELRSRLYVFPGGVFETVDYGDGDDSPGFYLEFEPERSRLPRRFACVPDQDPLERADAETCRGVLRALNDWEA